MSAKAMIVFQTLQENVFWLQNLVESQMKEQTIMQQSFLVLQALEVTAVAITCQFFDYYINLEQGALGRG